MPLEQPKSEAYQTKAMCQIDVGDGVLEQVSVKEYNFTESLLTPGLQTSVRVQSRYNLPNMKNLDEYYGKTISIAAQRKIISDMHVGNGKDMFETAQIIYRLDDRKRISYELEEFTLHACDPTLIQDAMEYVSHSWGCEPPHNVVNYVLKNCAKATSLNIEEAGPPKTYLAENIHPFQVVNQQSETSLSIGESDPSFVHFMTYQNDSGEDKPTHNWRSLAKMAKQTPTFVFTYSHKADTDMNYANPLDIMDYSFPCDFDLLSDVLNGYDQNGNQINNLIVFNKLTGGVSNFGTGLGECGASPYSAATNLGSADLQNSCDTNIEQYLLKRRGRMALLEQDKIALRLTIPFNPQLNAGRVINVSILTPSGSQNYGSGDYLIVSMTHNIKLGGLGLTILDCVSNTVGVGRQ